MTYIFPLAFALVALTALLLPTSTDRLRGSLGLPALALGAASTPLVPTSLGADPTAWITSALMLLGPSLLLAAAWRGRSRLTSRMPTVLLLPLATAATLLAAWPTLRSGGILPALLASGALAIGALSAWLVGRTAGLGRATRWLDSRLTPTRAQPPGQEAAPESRSGWFLAAGFLAALFGPYLSLVFLGAMIVAIAGGLRSRRSGAKGRVPVLWIAVVLLAASWWLAATVAGPDAQSLSALPDAPFSAAAELLLAAAVGIAAALFAGLWPLHGLLPRGAMALMSGVLLFRLGWPAWPLGLEHWQPLAVALAVASVWWAVPTRRSTLAMASVAFAACFSSPAASTGAWVLLATVAVHQRIPARLTAAAVAVGGYMVTGPLLGAEVVYTVLLAGAVTAHLATLATEPALA